MRYIDVQEEKAPVFRNIMYAFKAVWNADKWLPLGYTLEMTLDYFFDLFIQNILFLKVLLGIIEGESDFNYYVKYLGLFVLISLVTKGASWLFAYYSHIAAKKALKNINHKIFDKAGTLDISCYESPEFYDIYQRASEVVTKGYYEIFSDSFAMIAGSVLSLILVIATVAAIDVTYLIFLAPIMLVFAIELLKSKYCYKRDLEMTRNNRVKAYVQRTMFLRDYSKDIRTSNIFLVLMSRFKGAVSANIMILKKYGIGLFIYSMISTLFSDFLPIIGTYAFAGWQFINTDKLTVSGFSVVLSSINSVRWAMYDLSDCFSDVSEMALYFENLRKFYDYKPKITDGELEAGDFESLEFKNVYFRYPDAKDYSLSDISFKLSKGETLAVVGVNGAGKSTLIKLLLRFYDADKGEILYNGKPLSEYKIESLRRVFATVFQDYKNFALSVYENVMCRECSDEDKILAREALLQSGAWDKIKTLQKGGNTVLTKEFEKDGVGLSGGENQKVSVARLFAGDFQVAVLDEPSSALDPIAEYKMYENLIEATKDKTVIYISHRLSSAVFSDRIIVLEGGSIAEEGTHSELMKNGGEYSRMFTLQASSYSGEEGKAYA